MVNFEKKVCFSRMPEKKFASRVIFCPPPPYKYQMATPLVFCMVQADVCLQVFLDVLLRSWKHAISWKIVGFEPKTSYILYFEAPFHKLFTELVNLW